MSAYIELSELLARQGDHSIFAPSAAHRWLLCPGSLIPSLSACDVAGYDAAWGTVGHELAEEWLRSGKKPEQRLGEVVQIETGPDEAGEVEIHEITISRSMFRHVGRYVDWVKDLPGDHVAEQRVDLSQVMPIPNQGGTCDYRAMEKGLLRIRDLKLGIHIQVFAERNPQGMLYALGAFYEWDWLYDFQQIEIGIGQPRLDHWDVWTCSREEMLEFAEYVRKQAATAWSAEAYRKPGKEQCKFCPIKGSCPAMLKQLEDLMTRGYESMGEVVTVDQQGKMVEDNQVNFGRVPSPHSLTVEQLVVILDHRKVIENFLKAVEMRLNNLGTRGVEIPDRKMVRSKTNRVFTRESEAADLLDLYGLDETDLYTRKMKSPKQVAEELADLGYSDEVIDNLFQDIVFKPPGKPTLVPLTDKRPSLSEEADEIFGDLNEVDYSDLDDGDSDDI